MVGSKSFGSKSLPNSFLLATLRPARMSSALALSYTFIARSTLLVTERVLYHDWGDASLPQGARQSVTEIVPTTDLDTDRRCRWFEVAPATVVMVDRCSRTVPENPFLPLAQFAQALNQFRVLNWIEWRVDLLVLFQFHHPAFVDDASKVQYAVVVEIMRLQHGGLLAPASEAGKKQGESIKGAFSLPIMPRLCLRG